MEFIKDYKYFLKKILSERPCMLWEAYNVLWDFVFWPGTTTTNTNHPLQLLKLGKALLVYPYLLTPK